MNRCPPRTMPYTVRPGDTLFNIARKFNTDVNTIRYYNQGTDLSVIYIDQVICVPLPGGSAGAPRTGMAALELNDAIRALWEQHIYWTRLFLISEIFGLPDADLVANRLLRNPKDFEAVLRDFYGDNVAAKFSDLLTNHLSIAAELVKSAKAGDSAAAADAEKRWYQNADEIASFLAGINPNWSAQEWRRVLYEHLAMTKNEAVELLQRDYNNSISTFEDIEKEAMEMADLMINGIIRQFPNNFTR